MEDWKIKNRVDDIVAQHISIPNGSVNKPYQTTVDVEKWGLQDITHIEWKGLEDIGLVYNADNKIIEGIPRISGDMKITMVFRLQKDTPYEKVLNLIINPDPRSLWKDIPSDTNDKYWKADDVVATASFDEKRLVVASKRGRSHKNTGAFRDDDFAFGSAEGWSIVAVADGAGSAKYSRRGAQIACQAIVEYFEKGNISETKQCLYQGVKYAFEKIKAEAAALEDFHTTLIFVLFKKTDAGYVVMSFSVGDCPIALLSEDMKDLHLLNTLDVGEFGGGTRFLTQPDIFHSKTIPMESRFTIMTIPDFSYLFLMTDGIYDPKFEVEANLQNIACWQRFLEDLDGRNEEQASVDFNGDDVAARLSVWMDFWSPGNHDDRTLAIIYYGDQSS